MEYVINNKTNYLIYDNNNTIINESSTEIVFFGNNLRSILDTSCKYYGSSLKGRIIGARNIIKSRYRMPVIISERANLIFFPINGKKIGEELWFNFNAVKNYEKDGEFVKVTFVTDEVKRFMISYTIFNNQMLKCSRLLVILMNRG